MARPIKDTPILKGENARRFETWMKENESKKISDAEYSRIKKAGKSIKLFNSMEEYNIYNASTLGS
jgi:hypothetical protein